MQGTLSFDLSKVKFDDVEEACDALLEKGVSFDTGCGFGFRDWELDWSLKGMTPSEVKKWLKKNYPKLLAASKWDTRKEMK